jgi:hypothetical protein
MFFSGATNWTDYVGLSVGICAGDLFDAHIGGQNNVFHHVICGMRAHH